MAKLMRAEWYRLRHTSKYFKVFIVMCLIVVATTIQNMDVLNQTVGENLSNILSNAASGIPIFVGTVIAAAVGSFYSNRTAYYEIMDGNTTVSIILSKISVYTLATFGFYLIPQLILMTIMGISNGLGEMENPAVILILTMIIIAHVISSIVLHAMLCKNMVASVFPYARFMIFEMIGYSAFPMIAQQLFNLSDDAASKFANLFTWLPTIQLLLLGGKIDTMLVTKIVVGFIVEFAILFTLVYVSFKKKKFK